MNDVKVGQYRILNKALQSFGRYIGNGSNTILVIDKDFKRTSFLIGERFCTLETWTLQRNSELIHE